MGPSGYRTGGWESSWSWARQGWRTLQLQGLSELKSCKVMRRNLWVPPQYSLKGSFWCHDPAEALGTNLCSLSLRTPAQLQVLLWIYNSLIWAQLSGWLHVYIPPIHSLQVLLCVGFSLHCYCFSLLTYAWLNHNFKSISIASALCDQNFKNKQQCVCLYKYKDDLVIKMTILH